jgi:uncharacterized membrane protein
MVKNISLSVMTAFYFWAGLNHFWHTQDCLRIMPPYLPYPLLLVQISSFAESFLAILLPWPKSRRWACYGIIALLIRRGRHRLSSLVVIGAPSLTGGFDRVGLLA